MDAALHAASPQRARRDVRADPQSPFFRERASRKRPGVVRSKARAAAMAEAMGLDLAALREQAPRILIVVGSKGKGTTATYASATLAAAGLRVGTLTSPGFRSLRERIRIDGLAMTAEEFAGRTAFLDETLRAAGDRLPGSDGYLSPTGLFTLTAVRTFLDHDCDVWVLEAGMGGISDEVSLFRAGTVAITSIFAEHLGMLGNTVAEIAHNKVGVVTADTHSVVTLAQRDDVRAVLRERVEGHRLSFIPPRESPVAWKLPPGLIGANARLGIEAGFRLLDGAGIPRPDPKRLTAVVETVVVPGRLSRHQIDGRDWVIDAAANRFGAKAAVEWYRATVGEPDDVLLSVPDEKDRDGVLDVVAGLPVTAIRVPVDHLHYDNWPGPIHDLADFDLNSLGPRLLALGAIYFVGDLLDRLNINCEVSFVAG